MSNNTDKTKNASSGEGSNTALCYATKSPFKNDGNLIYNLRHHGWDKGEQTFQSDVTLNLQANHLSDEQRQRILDTVIKALDTEFLA